MTSFAFASKAQTSNTVSLSKDFIPKIEENEVTLEKMSTRVSLSNNLEISKTGMKNFNCKVEPCTSLSSQIAHERSQVNQQLYDCGRTGTSFNQSTNFKLPDQARLGEKKFSCHQCQKTFSTSKELRIHIEVHVKEASTGSSFMCARCGLEYSYLASYRKHVQKCGNKRSLPTKVDSSSAQTGVKIENTEALFNK